MSLALANVRTRKEWADIICADWRRSIDSIIQTGGDLAAAKVELPHGEFTAMIAADLPFTEGTARKLMRVAEHPAIANRSPATALPPSWAVLSELTALSEDDFRDAQERGLIGAGTGKRSARAVAGAYGHQGRRAAEFDKGKLPPVGDPRKPAMLPSPTEARKIARETGRMVAASDGNIYSGATAEEGAEYTARRTIVFRVLEAINLLANCDVDAFEWHERAERHWLHDFRAAAIDDAVEWLTTLKQAMGAVDA